MLHLQKQWNKQPATLARLNFSKEYGVPRVAYLPGLSPRSLVGPAPANLTTGAYTFGGGGKCLKYNAATTDTASTGFYPTSGDFTALICAATTDAASTSICWYESNGSGSGTYNGFGGGVGTTIREVHFAVTGGVWACNVQRGTAVVAATNMTAATAISHKVTGLCVRVNGTTGTVYVDGMPSTPLTDAGLGGSTAQSFIRIAQSGHTAANRYWRGELYLFVCWPLDLGESAAVSLSLNPWQVLQPLESAIIYSFPSIAATATKPPAGLALLGVGT